MAEDGSGSWGHGGGGWGLWGLRKQASSTLPTRAGAGCGRESRHPLSMNHKQAGPGLSQRAASQIPYGLRAGTTSPFHWEGN